MPTSKKIIEARLEKSHPADLYKGFLYIDLNKIMRERINQQNQERHNNICGNGKAV